MVKLNAKKIFKYGVAVGLLIFLHFSGILRPAESRALKALNPVFSSLHSAGSYLRIKLNEQTDKRNLTATVKQLEETVSNLYVENSRLKALEEENEVLREYLKFSKESEKQFILGKILSRKSLISGNLDQNLIIDKGSRDGIKIGAGVISKGTIIGKVIGLEENLAEVCLITNRDCKLAVAMQNSDKTAGIIKGELGLTVKMEFIPQTEQVSAGDIVITSGLEESIPRGLVVGKVAEVNKESNELWQDATIEPLVNFNNLIIVSVLLP